MNVPDPEGGAEDSAKKLDFTAEFDSEGRQLITVFRSKGKKWKEDPAFLAALAVWEQKQQAVFAAMPDPGRFLPDLQMKKAKLLMSAELYADAWAVMFPVRTEAEKAGRTALVHQINTYLLYIAEVAEL